MSCSGRLAYALTMVGTPAFPCAPQTCPPTDAQVLLWRKNPPAKEPTRYNLTAFSILLNEVVPGTEGLAAPTDCRRRPDQHCLELGEYDEVRLRRGVERGNSCLWRGECMSRWLCGGRASRYSVALTLELGIVGGVGKSLKTCAPSSPLLGMRSSALGARA